MVLRRIISGGQTGVDRAALDAALALNFPCGGWCPAGRLAEDGRIPDRYPLRECDRTSYRLRTLRNVDESDGTVVVYFDYLRGGTEQTVLFCIRRSRPYKLIDAAEVAAPRAAAVTDAFVKQNLISVLNVAGPRASEAPRAYAYTYSMMYRLLSS
jgi:hypothetical protein